MVVQERGEDDDGSLVPGAWARGHRQLAPMQLVAPPVVRKGCIVAVGQDGSRWHRSVLHAPCVTLEMLATVALQRQCPPWDTPEYTRPGDPGSIADCRRPSMIFVHRQVNLPGGEMCDSY